MQSETSKRFDKRMVNLDKDLESSSNKVADNTANLKNLKDLCVE